MIPCRVAELRRRGGFSVPEFAGLLRVSASMLPVSTP